MTPVVGIMTFALVIAIGIALYTPIYKQHFDTYGVRVRPRRKDLVNEEKLPKESLLLNTCTMIGEYVIALFPGLVDSRTKQLMLYANYRTPKHMETYMGIRSILVGIVGFMLLVGAVGNPMQLLFILPAALVTWTLPNFILARRVKIRQDALVRELPTVIDLLIVCAQAGLGLLMCIDKVSTEVADTCPIIASELKQLLQDVKIFAKSSSIGLKDMGERCGVEELATLASSLIAAEAKGSDISYPLKQQAEAIRDKLKRRKEEEAARVPVKMVPVIMVFIMPLILCPMLGPAIITIMQALGPVFSSYGK